MKLISWNVARKVVRCEEQILALQDFHPDILALQEVLPKAAARLRRLFEEMGLKHILDTTLTALSRPWSYGVLIASRWDIETTARQFTIPYPERSLSVSVSAPKCAFELHTVHVPTGSRDGSIRIDTMEAVYNQLVRAVHPAADPVRRLQRAESRRAERRTGHMGANHP